MIDAVAALSGQGDPSEPRPPAALARLFCGRGSPGDDGSTVHTGHSPYEDGYAALADLVNRGWSALPTLGDWPLMVYLAWSGDEEPALVELIEGDVTLRIFPTRNELKSFVRGLG